MMFFIVAVLLMILVVLTFHLYLSSVFDTSHLRAFQFALYALLVFLGLTIGGGLFQISNHGYETAAKP